MTFYYTAEYLKEELAKAERHVAELKAQIEEAEVRGFYFHIKNAMPDFEDCEALDEFYNTNWEISFGSRTLRLDNCAQVYQDIEALLENYMDDCGIQYKED